MTRITNLLTLVTFLLVHTFAALALNRENTSLDIATSANASLNTDGVCYGRGFEDERRTSYAHCQSAAKLIPEEEVPGTFHMHGTDDAFRLPRVIRYKSCVVAVNLESPEQQSDQSTWHSIMAGARRVISKCRRITDLTTGGFILVGDRGTIVVSMEKYLEDPLSLGHAVNRSAIS